MQRLTPSFCSSLATVALVLGTAALATPALATIAQDPDGTPAGDTPASAQDDEGVSDDDAGEAAPGDAGDSVFMPAPEAPPTEPSAPTPASPSSMEPAATDAPAEEADDKRISFLVTEVQVSGQVGLDAEDARDLLANRFGRLQDKVEVRSMGDVKTSLDQAALLAALGGDGAEIESITGMLDVDRVVYGRIARIGTVIDVSVRVVNVREGSVEMAMSRRLKAGTDPSLTLAVLDRQADKLLAWVIETYTDGAPSDAFVALKDKKLKPRKAKEDAKGPEVKEAEPPPVEAPVDNGLSFRFTWLGILGGTLAGAGLGLIAAAGLASIAGSFLPVNASTIPYLTEGSVAVGGAVLLGLGIGVIVADHYLFE
jgi:hypothetical protein